jgi:Arc/MetJ family transcription regulator
MNYIFIQEFKKRTNIEIDNKLIKAALEDSYASIKEKNVNPLEK